MAILQLLLIAFCAVSSSLACSCMREHPQKKFCNAGFAVLAYVASPPRDELMPNNPYPTPWKEQVYKLRIRETYKGHTAVKSQFFGSSYVKLYSPSSAVSCRVTLQPGSYYVLFGKIVGGNLYTSHCDWREKWSRLTPEQREGMRTQYSRGCDCLIGFCFSSKCRGLLTGCDGFDRNVNNECRAKHQRCEKQVGGRRCAWSNSKSYELCNQSVFFP